MAQNASYNALMAPVSTQASSHDLKRPKSILSSRRLDHLKTTVELRTSLSGESELALHKPQPDGKACFLSIVIVILPENSDLVPGGGPCASVHSKEPRLPATPRFVHSHHYGWPWYWSCPLQASLLDFTNPDQASSAPRACTDIVLSHMHGTCSSEHAATLPRGCSSAA